VNDKFSTSSFKKCNKREPEVVIILEQKFPGMQNFLNIFLKKLKTKNYGSSFAEPQIRYSDLIQPKVAS